MLSGLTNNYSTPRPISRGVEKGNQRQFVSSSIALGDRILTLDYVYDFVQIVWMRISCMSSREFQSIIANLIRNLSKSRMFLINYNGGSENFPFINFT